MSTIGQDRRSPASDVAQGGQIATSVPASAAAALGLAGANALPPVATSSASSASSAVGSQPTSVSSTAASPPSADAAAGVGALGGGDAWTAPALGASSATRLGVPSTSWLPVGDASIGEHNELSDAKLTAQILRLVSTGQLPDPSPLTPAQKEVLNDAQGRIAAAADAAGRAAADVPSAPTVLQPRTTTAASAHGDPTGSTAEPTRSDLDLRAAAAATEELAYLAAAAEAAALLQLENGDSAAQAGVGRRLAAARLGLAAAPPAATDLGVDVGLSDHGGWDAALAAHLASLIEVPGRGGSAGGLWANSGRTAAAQDKEGLGVQAQAQLSALIAAMPPSAVLQPILAFIAADLFRLQFARMEAMAALRVADDDGELPPLDEEEATMRRRRVQSVGFSDMWRFDRTPAPSPPTVADADGERRPALCAAVVVGALQAPQNVLNMFAATDAEHVVRLHRLTSQGWQPVWVHLPPSAAAEAPAASMDSPPTGSGTPILLQDLAGWLEDAQRAAVAVEKADGRPLPRDLRQQVEVALGQVSGRTAIVWPADDGEVGPQQAWRFICRSNTPGALWTLLVTHDAVEHGDVLAPLQPYGVLGGVWRSGRAHVLLCQLSSAPTPSWRLHLVPLPQVLAATWALYQLP